ncbi:MAG: hypothetical protein AAF713_12750 [Pseudomonadota bacterium]
MAGAVASEVSGGRGETTVLVSDEMRALYLAHRQPQGLALKELPEQPSQPAVEATAMAPDNEGPCPMQPIALRRDGQRPLTFQGALVWRRTAEDDFGFVQSVELYTASGGISVLALGLFASDLSVCRSVHAAALIADAPALDAAVRHFDPGAAVPDPRLASGTGHDLEPLANRLRRDFRRFLVEALGPAIVAFSTDKDKTE